VETKHIIQTGTYYLAVVDSGRLRDLPTIAGAWCRFGEKCGFYTDIHTLYNLDGRTDKELLTIDMPSVTGFLKTRT
jgi:hypothetical protein